MARVVRAFPLLPGKRESLLADVPSAPSSYAAEVAPFHAWFKGKVLEVSGIDPNKQPLGPECSSVFDWQEKR